MAKGIKRTKAPKKKVVKAKAAKKAPKSRAKASAARPSKAVPVAEPEDKPPVVTRPEVEHLLTMSFLRDEGEFCVRLEKSSGTMTELKNRSPDLLLRMVAGELEDLLD